MPSKKIGAMLTVAKYSVDKKPLAPFWFERQAQDGFDFALYTQEPLTDADAQDKGSTQEARYEYESMRELYAEVERGYKAGEPFNTTSLRSKALVLTGGRKVSKHNITALVANMTRLNFIEKVVDEGDARKHHLKPLTPPLKKEEKT